MALHSGLDAPESAAPESALELFFQNSENYIVSTNLFNGMQKLN